MIKAVVFDLDDTLFPEYDYVKSGYNAVAKKIEKKYGISGAADELLALFDKDRSEVFNRYLGAHGLPVTDDSVGELVKVYRTHMPDIKLSEEVQKTLAALREKGYKLGIITDGRPDGQRAKISALGLEGKVDKIIITDELGGKEYRKPNPKAFELMAGDLGLALDEMMYVGDNPNKDFVIGKYGVTTVKYNGGGLYVDGEYPDGIKEHKSINTMSELIDCVELNDENDDGLLDFVKGKLLGIMDFIHDVCVKENIKYSLSGGTMLGAVRHKGFIPWDDDIDIAMLREDYDRFANVINEYCEKSGEFIVGRNTLRVPNIQFKNAPIYTDKKIHGIKIDIFIYDNLPDDEAKRRKLIFKLKTLQGMMHKQKIIWSNYSLKGKVLLFGTKVLGMFRTKKSLIKSYNSYSIGYNGRQTKDKFISNDLFAVFHKPYKAEWTNDTVLTEFQDRKYYIFTNYDDILSQRYGNYMQLPPESERVPQHDITIEKI